MIAQPQTVDYITVGTDCSGIECPTQALENMNLNICHTFSSEHGPMIQEIIRNKFQPKILYGDLTRRNVDNVPQIDLYVAGFRVNHIQQPVSSKDTKTRKTEEP